MVGREFSGYPYFISFPLHPAGTSTPIPFSNARFPAFNAQHGDQAAASRINAWLLLKRGYGSSADKQTRGSMSDCSLDFRRWAFVASSILRRGKNNRLVFGNQSLNKQGQTISPIINEIIKHLASINFSSLRRFCIAVKKNNRSV